MGNMILEKEREYSKQMEPIWNIVREFPEYRDWTPVRRGRHAHASIAGRVCEFNGIIDIQMQLIDWERMPLSVPSDYPFDLWASANRNFQGRNLYCPIELYWQLPFVKLEGKLNDFLGRAWQMFSDLSLVEFVDSWPGPSKDPDTGPTFGGPRRIKR